MEYSDEEEAVWPGLFGSPSEADSVPGDKVESQPVAALPPAAPKIQSKALPPISIKYPSCTKGGYHQGEILNLICLEPKCTSKAVICSLCYDEQHSTHEVKPVKIIIQNARKYLSTNNKMNVNTEKIRGIIRDSEKNLLGKYQTFNTELSTEMTKVKENIQGLYSKLGEELQSKLTGQETSNIIEKLQGENDHTSFKNLVKELVESVVDTIDQEEGGDILTEDSLKEAVNAIKDKLDKYLSVKGDSLTKKLEQFLKFITDAASKYSIFSGQSLYTFSQTLHHPGVAVLNPTTVSSVEGNNYHFALMQPSLETKGNRIQTVQFKIAENTQSWVAVGICHKQTVTKNGFHFNYSSIGHGGYLISANGGSWSHLQSTHNNVVTSFNFEQGDIITIKYDPAQRRVTFKKKKSNQTHWMEIENVLGNELHLCVLFYYNADKVEYLGYEKPE